MARPQVQKAVIKNTNTAVITDAMVPRVRENVASTNSGAKVRTKCHPQHELELNENIEEPWVCMGDEEEDGCLADSP